MGHPLRGGTWGHPLHAEARGDTLCASGRAARARPKCLADNELQLLLTKFQIILQTRGCTNADI